ncbi:hypothetical protein V1290_000062 [Bradyrhizobium sp. AZCC 1578]|uniref:lytic transglycosylase domain-containing protein n=1 Tax=Bradyrhizobium sp. AZCC 1578 TaxID=3117027 RepID=UPI002FF073AE
MGLIDSIIGVESGGNPNATNPRSSASGLGQFIDSTWLATIRTARPDIANGKSDAELLALKTDPQLSREMTEAYANQNQGILARAGVPVTDGNIYLSHFAGPGGAVKVLQADPSAPVSAILGDAVVKANPFLARMTAGDLQAWASKKVGGSAPQAAPSSTAPAAAPAGLLKPANAGLLAQAPVFPAATPQAQPAQGGGLFAQMPAEQAPQAQPIFFAPRRSPDLSKLKAAFKPPVFSRG